MSQIRPLNATELWLANLERERTDRSYLDPEPRRVEVRFVPQPAPKETKKKREARDKLMFNAGRYAAGARDKTACIANEQLEREINA